MCECSVYRLVVLNMIPVPTVLAGIRNAGFEADINFSFLRNPHPEHHCLLKVDVLTC